MADKKPGLAFLDRLTPAQWEMAAMVGKTAEKFGVPPRLAIAVAFEESRLGARTEDGGSGEIGLMQVLPSTGQEMGYSPKDLRVLEKNIEAGVRYLKQNLDQFDGHEGMAVAAYNTGPGNVGRGIIPESTRGYISRLYSWGAFDVPTPTEKPAEEPAAEPQAAPAASQDEGSEDFPDNGINGEVALEHSLSPGEEVIPNLSEVRDSDKEAFGRMGAAAGAGLGTTYGGIKLGEKAIDMWKNRPAAIAAAAMKAGMAGQPPAGTAPAAPPGAPAAPGGPRVPAAPGNAPGALGTPNSPLAIPPEGYPKATGPGSATFNWGRAFGLPEIEAAQALNTTSQPGGAQDLLNKRAAALNRIQTQFPSGSFAENPAYGGLMTPSASVGSGPRQSFVMQPPEAPTPESPGRVGGLQSLEVTKPVPTIRVETKTAGALESLTKSFMEPFEKIGSKVATVAKPILGPLSRIAGPAAAGYSIGRDVGDIYGEYQNRPAEYQPNRTNIGLSAAGALGTGVSLVAPLSPLGLPLAVGAPTARAIKDKYQQIKAAPKQYEETMQRALSNVDPMGNPLP